jgi:hypothetical protein
VDGVTLVVDPVEINRFYAPPDTFQSGRIGLVGG